MIKPDRQRSGLELLQSWIADKRRPPMGDTLDFDLVEVDNGRAVFESTPGRHVLNPLGTVHGGYAATLLDSACGCAALSTLGTDHTYTTVELKVSYHRPITVESGKLRTEGKIVSLGRRVAFTEARIVDSNGRLYASATSTLLILEGLPNSGT
ncbi:MAG TPA: PaaI family thioesterase [Burkholderiales bacterium]|nr:PaaI family thioesterase [Burkholderiales bacterium]